MYLSASNSAGASEEVYWRKANAIHGWFVRNCQDGVDECEPADVTREQLEQLVADCRTVLANKAVTVESTPAPVADFVTDGSASTVDIGQQIMDIMTTQAMASQFQPEADENDPLPPVGGFFFGGTARDEWYYDDIRGTEDKIENLLTLSAGDSSWSFTYQSSW